MSSRGSSARRAHSWADAETRGIRQGDATSVGEIKAVHIRARNGHDCMRAWARARRLRWRVCVCVARTRSAAAHMMAVTSMRVVKKA
eukprot:820129-Prymnesium_polylepis.1